MVRVCSRMDGKVVEVFWFLLVEGVEMWEDGLELVRMA